MCLLSYYPSLVMPDLGRLHNGAEVNEDGFGYAIADTTNQTIIRGHGFIAGQVIERFAADRDRHPNGPALFHSRWSTGGTAAGNCHPFMVGRDAATVVAHNGVLFSTAGDKEKRCDTRVFAEEIMPLLYRRLDRPRVRVALEAYLGAGNKLAVITVNPRYRHNGYLFNEAAGIWAGEEWHSNTDYLPYVKSLVRPYAHDWTNWESRRLANQYRYRCDLCGAVGSVDPYTDTCGHCQSCQWCSQAECQCYRPEPAAIMSGEQRND